MRSVFTALALVMTALCHPAYAQSADDFAALRQELQTLRAEQAHTAVKIDRVEAEINQLARTPLTTPPIPSPICLTSRRTVVLYGLDTGVKIVMQ